MYVSAGKSCGCQHITDAEINVYKNRNACNGFSLEIVWKALRKIWSWSTGTIASNALYCERARWDESLVSIKRSRSPRSSLQIKAIVQTRFQGLSYSPGDKHEGILGTRFAIAVIHTPPSLPFLSHRSSNIPPQPTMNYLARNSFRTRTIAVIGLNRERNVVRMGAAVCWGRGLRDETKTAARENWITLSTGLIILK